MLKECGSLPGSFLCLDGEGIKEMSDLRETRKQMFAQMEQKLQEMNPKEEDVLLSSF